MVQFFSLYALGILLVLIQSVAATWMSPNYTPDFLPIYVLGIGIAFSNIRGSVLVVAVGYFVDSVSGSLLGQYALAYLLIFQFTQIAIHRLNLAGRIHRGAYCFLATLVLECYLSAVGGLLNPVIREISPWTPMLFVHALINGLMGLWLVEKVVMLAEYFRKREMNNPIGLETQ